MRRFVWIVQNIFLGSPFSRSRKGRPRKMLTKSKNICAVELPLDWRQVKAIMRRIVWIVENIFRGLRFRGLRSPFSRHPRRERHIYLVSIMFLSTARMVGLTGGMFGNSFRKTSIGSSCPKLETDVRPRWKSRIWFGVKVGRKLRGTARGTDAVPDEDCGMSGKPPIRW